MSQWHEFLERRKRRAAVMRELKRRRGGFIRRSIEGIRVDSERIRQIEPDKVRFSDVVGIFLRGWPYIRPMFWHVLGFLLISVIATVWGTFWGITILTLIYQNVILDDPVALISAKILLLDPAVWVYVESLTVDQRFELVPPIVMLAVLSGTLGAMIENGGDYYRVWVMQNINQNLRMHLMSQLHHLSLKFHADSKTGDGIYRLFQDSAMVTQIIQSLVIDPLLMTVRFFIGIFVVMLFSPLLGFAILITWVPMIILANIMSPKLRHLFLNARFRNSALTSTIQESIEGIRTIKVNGLERERQTIFETASVDAFIASHDARVRLLLFGFVAFMLAALPLAFIELYAAILAYEQVPTYMTALLAGFGFAVWGLGSQDAARARAREGVSNIQQLLLLWGRAQDMAMGLNRVYQILDLVPEVQNQPGAQPLQSIESDIRFVDLKFAYPERDVFESLTFDAKLGEVTAIMGPTGSGKSTLMLLLLRLFEYQDGSIEINGRDIRKFTFESVREKITLATQENILFSMNVRDNIAYARQDATLDEIKEAARIACADEFIEKLPDGYDTFLGERASQLSTGQRQRLVIARAILKNTPILILDEPTASLDAETERRIMSNLKDWAQNRTVFLVTHRLSTIRQADRIAFIRDGRIADYGSHNELIANPRGEYQRFVEAELATAQQLEESA
ncbi:MAG: ABC transporter ATP-binding protein [Gammaproteobacteria bacterium]|nr:ABC transporter ATP-binding protein [Gammaproteobacteria bacterium]